MKFYQKLILFFTVSLFVCISSPVFSQNFPLETNSQIVQPVMGYQGMVASQEQYATKAGIDVLKEGGNAIDSAVTVGFTLAVTLPNAGNIGGGGFMLIHSAKDGQNIALDYREKAPLLATETMFLNEQGEPDKNKSQNSYLSVGVPGTVAGLISALEKYGTISLERALKPAIDLAENGFPVSEDLHSSLTQFANHLQVSQESKQTFLKENGEALEVGDLLIQKNLAHSLKLIAKEGKKAFYQGEIADKIVEDMRNNGGLITKEDLRRYQPVWREPVKGNYRGYEVVSMPPPSSGGVHLIEMLNILEGFPLKDWGQNTAKSLHVMIESMKYAYFDRFTYMGDPDFIKIPISQLISKDYAQGIKNKINLDKATPSTEIAPPIKLSYESPQTTHFSVADNQGNVVSNTYTLNYAYGNGWTVPETGILLNNEMDDFTAKVGTINGFGLRGGENNKIEPEKRMLSSMTPTIVLKDDQPFLVTGSPGGSRIINIVLQMIVNVIDHHLNIASATNAPRLHHQWYPDEVIVERAMNQDTLDLLKEKGHNIKLSNVFGTSESIIIQDNVFYGSSDPRRTNGLSLPVSSKP